MPGSAALSHLSDLLGKKGWPKPARSEPVPTTVGAKPAGKGPFGTHDQAGNVAEWVGGEPATARGGSFLDGPFLLTTVSRTNLDPARTYMDVGVRCAF